MAIDQYDVECTFDGGPKKVKAIGKFHYVNITSNSLTTQNFNTTSNVLIDGDGFTSNMTCVYGHDETNLAQTKTTYKSAR